MTWNIEFLEETEKDMKKTGSSGSDTSVEHVYKEATKRIENYNYSRARKRPFIEDLKFLVAAFLSELNGAAWINLSATSGTRKTVQNICI